MSVNTELQKLVKSMGGMPLEEDSNSDLVQKLHSEFTGQTLAVVVDSQNRCDRTAREILKALYNGSVVVFELIHDDGIVIYPCVRVEFSDSPQSNYVFYTLQIIDVGTDANPDPKIGFELFQADDLDSYPVIRIR